MQLAVSFINKEKNFLQSQEKKRELYADIMGEFSYIKGQQTFTAEQLQKLNELYFRSSMEMSKASYMAFFQFFEAADSYSKNKTNENSNREQDMFNSLVSLFGSKPLAFRRFFQEVARI